MEFINCLKIEKMLLLMIEIILSKNLFQLFLILLNF